VALVVVLMVLPVVLLTTACGRGGVGAGAEPVPAVEAGAVPALPDGGAHVLAVARAPDGAVWVGTYGRGIFVLRPGAGEWERIAARRGDATSISWDFVNAFAFPADGSVWYGTVGNGFGRSTDGGRTWRNWGFRDLGPEWQYVAPGGVRARGDTVYIATADGLRFTADGGATWSCFGGAGAPEGGAKGHDDACASRAAVLPTEYLLALELGGDGAIWIGHLAGLSVSYDGGRSWQTPAGAPAGRVRALLAEPGGAVWAATEDAVYRHAPGADAFARVADVAGVRALASAGAGRVLALTADGPVPADPGVAYEAAAGALPAVRDAWAAALIGETLLVGGREGLWAVPGRAPAAATAGAGAAGTLALPAEPLHLWFERPVRDAEGNPHIDGAYRYGSTMGGNFQQHQGVEFNGPAGTPVRAAGAGTVVFAGQAEAGANTVAILHDVRWEDRYVFTTYYHNTKLEVEAGARVEAGDLIARIGNTGRATNDHLHFEVHVAPTADVSAIVDPAQRFPPHTVNPQLWLRPLPGTGIVAGRVVDAEGQPVPGARIHGLTLPYPTETPYSSAETYEDRAHPDPAYGEHFAVGDVPAGEYRLHVEIAGQRVERRVRVAPGMVTFVEFAPGPG